MDDRYAIADNGHDILSHTSRGIKIHVLTLDQILATDICGRIHNDSRMKYYKLIRPRETRVRQAVEEIDGMARDTVYSRLLIIDVRRITLTKLQWAYNKIVGYNRRDLNKLCYIILIGDGPGNLFRAGKALDVFVPHLAMHRVDFHPALFFYDPLLHYEPDEIERSGIDYEFVVPDKIPRRLVPHFKKDEDMRVDRIRRYFRATGKDDQVRRKRLKRLRNLYKKRIAEQFPNHKDQTRAWLSKKGVGLASERLHLYPLFFEDWVHDLMQKAAEG
ncbi:MAG: hypothetical protein CEE38_15140 [Planctomycetes bacterium B3_Pla]|nr:MAG: hypothetical protein CEE38_15140 [Planctomycetes bacterium B3_Pla]